MAKLWTAGFFFCLFILIGAFCEAEAEHYIVEARSIDVSIHYVCLEGIPDSEYDGLPVPSGYVSEWGYYPVISNIELEKYGL